VRVGRLLSPGRGLRCRRCRTRFGRGPLRVSPYLTIIAPIGLGRSVAIPALCVACIRETPAPERLAAYEAYWLDAAGPDPVENARVWREIEVAVAAGAA
jgi:hypothetical protein